MDSLHSIVGRCCYSRSPNAFVLFIVELMAYGVLRSFRDSFNSLLRRCNSSRSPNALAILIGELMVDLLSVILPS